MDTALNRCRPEGEGRFKVLQENWMDLQNILLFNEVLQIVPKVPTTPPVCQLNKSLSSF